MARKVILIGLFIVLVLGQNAQAQSASNGYMSNPSFTNSASFNEPYGINMSVPNLNASELYTRHHRLGASAGLGSSTVGTTSDTPESMPAISGRYQAPANPAQTPTSPYSYLPNTTSFSGLPGAASPQGPSPTVESMGTFAPSNRGESLSHTSFGLIGRPQSFSGLEGRPILPNSSGSSSPALLPSYSNHWPSMQEK